MGFIPVTHKRPTRRKAALSTWMSLAAARCTEPENVFIQIAEESHQRINSATELLLWLRSNYTN